MAILAKRAIHEFARKRPKSTDLLNDWFEKAIAASRTRSQEVKAFAADL
ncbi:MAG TPA: hypothetical protein PK339_15895 [Flavitalea sp.]|nr:hypothetical protein [Flavitalea sp.]